MPVAAEGYPTCAGGRGDLYTVIDSHSLGIILPGLDFYGLGILFSYNEGSHCVVHEPVPVIPRLRRASVLHTNEEASRRFPTRWEQIFYDAIAKQGTGVGHHVVVRPHSIEPCHVLQLGTLELMRGTISA